MLPDAWERFERAVDAAVKSGPMHKLGKHKAKATTNASPQKKRGRPTKTKSLGSDFQNN
jgi:hypothetical protein